MNYVFLSVKVSNLPFLYHYSKKELNFNHKQ
jgi:hypothetical protein